jgi:AraC-like DNA-binding protein
MAGSYEAIGRPSCTFLPMTLLPGPAAIRAWKPAVLGIREVLHARFAEHAYPPHTHDTWTVFVVDDGAIHYDLDGKPRSAVTRSKVSVLPPWVVHDGRTANSSGYRKRVLYVEPEVLGESRIGGAVDAPELPDASLWHAVDRLHAALDCPDDAIEAETRFAFVTERIRAVLPVRDEPTRPLADLPPDVAVALRAWLDERLTGAVKLGDAAIELDVGVTALARAFAREFGIPPHAYVIGRRLDLARDRILGGEPLASIAADLGFSDQAHLTRAFKRFLGTTPGQFKGGRDRRTA